MPKKDPGPPKGEGKRTLHEDVPDQTSRGIQAVTAPLYKSSTSTFFYVLSTLAVLIFAWYAYKGVSVVSSAVSNASPFGSSSSSSSSSASSSSSPSVNVGERRAGTETAGHDGGEMSVERRIEELAKAIGLSSKDLASAIAGAVREYAPPASLSSMSKKAEKTGGSQIVDELTGKEGEEAEQATWADTIEAMVGMEDMPEGA